MPLTWPATMDRILAPFPPLASGTSLVFRVGLVLVVVDVVVVVIVVVVGVTTREVPCSTSHNRAGVKEQSLPPW